MGIVFDITLAVPIGIIYNMIFHQLANIINGEMNEKLKTQRNLLIIFGGGMIGLIISRFIDEKNKALIYGLYFGSILLLLHSIFYNWKIMQNDTKIIVMILTFVALIWYTYAGSDGENVTKTEKTYISSFLTSIYNPNNEDQSTDEPEIENE